MATQSRCLVWIGVMLMMASGVGGCLPLSVEADKGVPPRNAKIANACSVAQAEKDAPDAFRISRDACCHQCASELTSASREYSDHFERARTIRQRALWAAVFVALLAAVAWYFLRQKSAITGKASSAITIVFLGGGSLATCAVGAFAIEGTETLASLRKAEIRLRTLSAAGAAKGGGSMGLNCVEALTSAETEPDLECSKIVAKHSGFEEELPTREVGPRDPSYKTYVGERRKDLVKLVELGSKVFHEADAVPQNVPRDERSLYSQNAYVAGVANKWQGWFHTGAVVHGWWVTWLAAWAVSGLIWLGIWTFLTTRRSST